MSVVDPCTEAEGALPLWRVGRLDGPAADRLVGHLLTCPDCLLLHWEPLAAAQLQAAHQLMSEDPGDPELSGFTVEGVAITELSDRRMGGAALAEGALRRPGPPQRTRSPSTQSSPALGQIRRVGTVLPRLPKGAGLRGYHLYLGAGLPAPTPLLGGGARLTVEVEDGEVHVRVEALGSDCLLDGAPLPGGRQRPCSHTHTLVTGDAAYLIEPGRRREGEGWRGLALLRHAGPTHVITTVAQIGRDPGCEIPLSDRRTASNLIWAPGGEGIAPGGAWGEGAAPYLDQVEVHRRHAELRLSQGALGVRAKGRHPVFRLRRGDAVALRQEDGFLALSRGDLLRVGNGIFEIL